MSTTQGTMSIVSDSTSITLQTALQLLDTRFTALEHNIANTSTPGFLAQRVEFEDELSLAIANGDPTTARAETVTSADPVDGFGNNVDLGKEMVQLTETALRQQMLVRALNDRYSRIRIASEDF